MYFNILYSLFWPPVWRYQAWLPLRLPAPTLHWIAQSQSPFQAHCHLSFLSDLRSLLPLIFTLTDNQEGHGEEGKYLYSTSLKWKFTPFVSKCKDTGTCSWSDRPLVISAAQMTSTSTPSPPARYWGRTGLSSAPPPALPGRWESDSAGTLESQRAGNNHGLCTVGVVLHGAVLCTAAARHCGTSRPSGRTVRRQSQLSHTHLNNKRMIDVRT